MAPSTITGTSAAQRRGSKQGSPPTGELGATVQGGLSPWTNFAIDELENVPELQFPQSVRTYAAMRNDSQVQGLFDGATMPVRRYKWMINDNGCERARVEGLSKDLNLPIKGDPPSAQRGRSKGRFSFHQHIKDAFLAICFGFYDFEQVGYIGDDGLWHLRKLAPRPPLTVNEIRLSENGGILYIEQNINQGRTPLGVMPQIPIDRLVHYAWDMEGANWQGRSMFRSIYRNWLIKDRLLRVDAIKHERNGMGVPHATGAQGMTDPELEQLNRLAQAYKAGENSGAAFPFGTKLELLGVQGTIPDTWGSINGHNEEMARRFLMMFLQLGSTLHGSRSLGKDFIEQFQLSQEMLAIWFADVFNEHVIEDYWDWNYGENEEFTPYICYERNDDPRFAAADLGLLVQNGVITVDDELEQAVRESLDLPEADPKTARPRPTDPSPVGDQPGQPSTQPGKSDPEYPDQNPDAGGAKAQAKNGGGRDGDHPSPDQNPGHRRRFFRRNK